MFAIHASVTIVTASLATNLTGIELPLLAWSAIILVLSNVYLARNTYAMLDRAIKLLMILLALSTITAVTLTRSEEHTSELQSRGHLVCRLLLEKNIQI